MFKIKGGTAHYTVPRGFDYHGCADELNEMGYILSFDGLTLVVGKKAPVSRGFVYEILNNILYMPPKRPGVLSPREATEIEDVIKKYGVRL